MLKKNIQVKIVRDWCLEAKKYPAGYKISEASLGFNPDECIQAMTAKQLKFISALVAAVYGKGCDDSRRWNKEINSTLKEVAKEYLPEIQMEDYGFPSQARDLVCLNSFINPEKFGDGSDE